MFRTVWLLRHLSFNGQMCLRDDKDAALSSRSIAVAREHGKRHAMRAHKPHAVSDWLNPNSLWTMSAFVYIEM